MICMSTTRGEADLQVKEANQPGPEELLLERLAGSTVDIEQKLIRYECRIKLYY